MENKETNREQLLKQLFAQHPKVDKFFMTSDDQAFIEAHHANSHAQRFADQDVAEYDRSTFEFSTAVKEASDKATGTPAADEVKTEAPAQIEFEENAKAETTQEDEKATLTTQYTELFGKKPNHFIGVAKLKELITVKEAEAK